MLNLTQAATLKAALLAETNATIVAAINSFSTSVIVDWLNEPSDFVIWSKSVSVQSLYDAITWANLTPADTPDGSEIYTNRALSCQAKQINLQIMLQGQTYIDGTKTNIRSGLQDALTNIPSGTAGAAKSGGWGAVKTAMQRFATRGEKIFSSGTGTEAAPGAITYEGRIDDNDVVVALTQV